MTTVILAPLAAIAFHHHRAACPLRTRLYWAAAVTTAGLAGFVVAGGIHAAQLKWLRDLDPVEVIGARARARTANDGRNELVRTFDRSWTAFIPEPVAYPANCFLDYFRQPVASAPAVWTTRPLELSLGQATIALALCGLAAAVAVRRTSRTAVALLIAAGIGFLSAASWQVLAVNHMCVHQHLNLIVFQIAFLPIAAIILGHGIGSVAARVCCRRAIGPLLLVAGFATAAIAIAKARTEPDQTLETVPAAESKPIAASVTGSVELFVEEYRLHHTQRVEIGRAVMVEPRETRSRVFVLTGWALDFESPRRVPSARLAILVNGQPVNARVERFGLPHLEQLAGRRRLPIGFAAIVPAEALPPGAVVRVFAVSTADPTRVTELEVPPLVR